MNPIILLAEDHDAVRASLCRWLSTAFPDYHFIEAKDGEQGVAMAYANQSSVVVMDMPAPKAKGVRPSAPRTKVVVLSLHHDQDYWAAATAVGTGAHVLASQPLKEPLTRSGRRPSRGAAGVGGREEEAASVQRRGIRANG